jgi:hypothetical protein
MVQMFDVRYLAFHFFFLPPVVFGGGSFGALAAPV